MSNQLMISIINKSQVRVIEMGIMEAKIEGKIEVVTIIISNSNSISNLMETMEVGLLSLICPLLV